MLLNQVWIFALTTNPFSASPAGRRFFPPCIWKTSVIAPSRSGPRQTWQYEGADGRCARRQTLEGQRVALKTEDGLFCPVTDQTELSERSSPHYRVDHRSSGVRGWWEGEGGVRAVRGQLDGKQQQAKQVRD